MEEKMIAVRLTPEQSAKLDALCDALKWSKSDVIRSLIEAASIVPPAVVSRIDPSKESQEGKKVEALVAMMQKMVDTNAMAV